MACSPDDEEVAVNDAENDMDAVKLQMRITISKENS